MSFKLHHFLGISVNTLTMDDLHELIIKEIKCNNQSVISNHNLHSIYIYHHDAKMREFYQRSKYVHIDGMSIIFLGKLFGKPFTRRHRVTYVDWIRPLIQKANEHNWRVFFVGSKPGVGEKAAQILCSEFKNLQIKTHHGYFDREQNQEVIRQINCFNPHILLVGMGMPKQEHWILDNLNEISANIILPCGACMDYVAGVVPTPPRWMGRIGLEWLYRLMSEPGRLWKRYLVEPWFIVKLIIIEIFNRLKGFEY